MTTTLSYGLADLGRTGLPRLLPFYLPLPRYKGERFGLFLDERIVHAQGVRIVLAPDDCKVLYCYSTDRTTIAGPDLYSDHTHPVRAEPASLEPACPELVEGSKRRGPR